MRGALGAWVRKVGERPLVFVCAVVSIAAAITLTSQLPTAFASSTTPKLVARWTFDGVATGQNAPDSVGSNHATPGSEDVLPPAPSGDVPPVSYTNTASMQFDGSNYFTINNPVSKNFTICAWIKTTSSGGGTQHWTSAPIMDSEVGGVAYDFGFGVGNGGKLMFGNGGVYPEDNPSTVSAYWDEQVNGATTVNDNMWHNVCVTRNGDTGENILYVDAQVDGSGTSGIGTQTENAYARIGWGYDGAELYQGLIDDVRVYNGVLTQAQLANLTAGSNDPDLAPGDDGDGIDGSIEAAAPKSGDANGDNIPDNEQPNVASFVNSVTSHYVSVEVDSGCNLSAVQSLTQNGLGTDGNYRYPVGLVNFTAHCASTDVKLYFYNPPAGDFALRKYIHSQYNDVAGATFTRTTIGGLPVLVVSYHLTDNGPLDADGTLNGAIVDPVGPAVVGVNGSGTPSDDGGRLADTGVSTNFALSIANTLLAAGVSALVLQRLARHGG